MEAAHREEEARAPTVSVIIATRDRPALLQRALDAVHSQDYAGVIECVVVFDQSEVDPTIESDSNFRPVRSVRNQRTPGLAGARNSGILVASGDLIAFCDDDDEWLPHKLRSQIPAISAATGVVVAGVRIDIDGKVVERVPDAGSITTKMLARSRVAAAHPSTVLVRRDLILEEIGLVDEDIPGGYGEDYDWLLRAAKVTTVAAMPVALVVVYWHPGSFFAQRWLVINEALDYLLAKHPDILADRRGSARVYGQQAFALSALGRRSEAVRRAWRALKRNPAERRAHLALLVASGAVEADTIVGWANSRGRGI